MLWRNNKKNNDLPLPAVYVSLFDRKSLVTVIREVKVVGRYLLIILWFRWKHDLPTSFKPEWEPLAIAYEKSAPRYVFWRPHRVLKWRKVDRKPRWSSPMPSGNKIVVFVSYIGHAFRVSRRSILLWTMLEMLLFGMSPPTVLSVMLQLPWPSTALLAAIGGFIWVTVGWRWFWKNKNIRCEDGVGPNEADLYEGVSFRQFVTDTLLRLGNGQKPLTNKHAGDAINAKGPENNKNKQRHRKARGSAELLLAIILPKTIARLFLAGRSFGKGDLRKAYKNLAKAYISLPKRFKLTYYGCWLLDNIAGTRRLIEENIPLTKDDLRYMRNKFYFACFFEHPIILMSAIKPEFVDEDRPDEEDLREHAEKIARKKIDGPVDVKRIEEILQETLKEVVAG
jgi:hypothetical protein